MNNLKFTLIISILVLTSTILLGENGPKPVPFDFSGYTIVLQSADFALTDDNTIFSTFGDIRVTKVNGKYFYLLGEFKTNNSASDFLEKVIESRFPTAYVVVYEEGEMLGVE